MHFSANLFWLLLSSLVGAALSKKSEPALLVKEDLPYIECEVCERVVTELVNKANQLRDDVQKTKKPLEEFRIVEFMENMCQTENVTTGEWMRKLDIIETANAKYGSGKYLKLMQPGGVAKCNSECATIAKSCQKLFDDEIDPDDLSSLLWKKVVSLDVAKVLNDYLTYNPTV